MSAVFILMVIMHLLIVMYNNMSDNSISFEEQYFYETNAGNSMGKLCFWMFVLKTDLYSFMGFFFLYIHTIRVCTHRGQGTLLFTSSNTSYSEWVKVFVGLQSGVG